MTDTNSNSQSIAEFIIETGDKFYKDCIAGDFVAINHSLNTYQNNHYANLEHGFLLATKHGHLKLTQLFIGHQININARDYNGNTALIEAAANHHFKIVKLLLNHNADATITNHDGINALLATCLGSTGSLTDSPNNSDINKQNIQAIVQILLEKDKNSIYAKDWKSGNTALHYAIFISPQLVELILQNSAHINEQNYAGLTPLMLAAISSDGDQIVPILFKYGASADIKDPNGKIALHYAVCNVKSLSAILDHTADPNITDNNGRTALYYAYLSYNSESIQLLKQRGGTTATIPVPNGELSNIFHQVANPPPQPDRPPTIEDFEDLFAGEKITPSKR